MQDHDFQRDGEAHGLERTILNLNWTTLLTGMLLGMMVLYLFGTRPLLQRLDTLSREMSVVRSGLNEVSATKHDVDQANSLLSALIQQRQQVQDAQDSLNAVNKLTTVISHETQRVKQADVTLGKLAALNHQLLAAGKKTEQVDAALARLEQLQSQVTQLGQASTQAQAGMVDARATVHNLSELKEQVLNSTAELNQARSVLENARALHCDLMDADDSINKAQAAAERFATLQETVTAAGEDLEQAECNAQRLIDLQDQLVTDDRLRMDAADENLARLVQIQAQIAERTEELVTSIETLEVLGDFQGEFEHELLNIQDMRRQLTELILLRSTLNEVQQTLQPLTELSNLRRLNGAQLREAARHMLNQRRARLAGEESDVK